VSDSSIKASEILVGATETPRNHTVIKQTQVNAALGGTFALVVSLGFVRSVNRIYDDVEAKIIDSDLTATAGVIDVKATLAPYEDGDSITDTPNLESFLQSYNIHRHHRLFRRYQFALIGHRSGYRFELEGARYDIDSGK
jgi:hypothetical protein